MAEHNDDLTIFISILTLNLNFTQISYKIKKKFLICKAMGD